MKEARRLLKNYQIARTSHTNDWKLHSDKLREDITGYNRKLIEDALQTEILEKGINGIEMTVKLHQQNVAESVGVDLD